MARRYRKIIKKDFILNNCAECPECSCEDGGIGGSYYWCERLKDYTAQNGIHKNCPLPMVKPKA